MKRIHLSLAAAVTATTLLAAGSARAQSFDHLKCFKIKDPQLKVKYTATLTPEQNTFLTQTGCEIKVPAKVLCVDVDKSNVVPAPPVVFGASNARDYLCYKLKCVKQQFNVPVEDQFGNRVVTVKKPDHICAPAHVIGFPDAPTPTPCLPPAPTPTQTPSGCLSNMDCPMGQICMAGMCVMGACSPGQQQGCSTGQPGICASGIQTCNGMGQYGPCVQSQSPQAETCNNLDDDCDGMVDEGNPGGGGPCNTGQPGPCAVGTTVCSGGGLVCMNTTSPQPETCNGIDDNCDGTVDNLPPLSCGIGACHVTGPACVGGMPQTCTPGSPSTEVCDNIDNDCDGTVDEGGAGCANNANSTGNCVSGMCQNSCNAGFADCDGMVGTGCEVSTTGDVNNCGGCGLSCPNRPNATRTCATSTCAFTCNSGFANCNGDPMDGCEKNTNTDPQNCGLCGTVCGMAQSCVAGTCQ